MHPRETPRLDALAVGDPRVYWVGPIALDHVATLVGDLTEEEIDAELEAIAKVLSASRTARVATLPPDGGPPSSGSM